MSSKENDSDWIYKEVLRQEKEEYRRYWEERNNMTLPEQVTRDWTESLERTVLELERFKKPFTRIDDLRYSQATDRTDYTMRRESAMEAMRSVIESITISGTWISVDKGVKAERFCVVFKPFLGMTIRVEGALDCKRKPIELCVLIGECEDSRQELEEFSLKEGEKNLLFKLCNLLNFRAGADSNDEELPWDEMAFD